ncbi:uncharacterized protein LOC110632123 isoform X2 [Hevea brasiliensis]|uniref:uncharacterized protein LOC110632123 isoform X2 n=1 Tax=Hevea brasiliensis TaxID=3981 RepID=UPI0025CCA30B|nr:uncharacterized protein LOC110632123 isoform X2 [Hevea brasiliensis]
MCSHMIPEAPKNAVLLQSTKVEAIKWTGSGDGILAGGIDVILWRRRNRSWEIAWKFKRDEPQNLVSATWSIEGPSATAAYPSKLHIKGPSSASKCVLVCYGDSISEYEKFELRHPQPVFMLQWRPLTARPSQRDAKYFPRNMLLTCCLDGTARLWTEVDNGKVRKFGKENNDRKTSRKFFCVAAVIEINQVLNGNLGTDIFLNWAIESGGIYRTGEDTNQIFSTERYGHDRVGRCEWFIGFGPGTVITFWAIHCLDDVSPMRFPRVTLWKRQELQDLEGGHLHGADFSKFNDSLLLNKVIILRNCLSGPPEICSLVHLLPCNSLVWSLLHTQRFGDIENTLFNNSRVYKYLSYSARGVLNGGHTGKILEVAMHPYIYELELAASLDSNGLVLFWSVSTISNCNLDFSTFIPTWKLCGKFVTNDSCSKYTSLKWAPSVLDEDCVLLMGHVGGIDCFLVRISQIEGEEDIVCHFICTIPLTGHGPYEDGVLNIFAIPLPSTCDKTFEYNKFMLLGVWMKSFQALSWEVTLHSYDLPATSCECNFDDQNSPMFTWKFENTFANKRYCLGVNPCSSQFPEPYSHDQITSFSVVGPGNLIPMHEKLGFDRGSCCCVPAYIMATGFSDGSLKLWRSNSSKLRTPHSQILWELVGKFVAHQGPVNAICLTDCGQKIATISVASKIDGTSILHIWDSINLIGAGCFVLEDILSIDGDVVALNWLALGNGRLFLGVCTQNNLQVYAQKCSGGQTLVKLGKSLNLHNWTCIAVTHTFPAIHDLLWGPQAAAVIVHDNYFSIFSQWLFLVDDEQLAKRHSNFIRVDGEVGKDKGILSSIFTDLDISIGDLTKSSLPIKINDKIDCQSSSLFVPKAQLKHGSCHMLGFWSLVEIAEKLRRTLPVYHPEALLMNLYSGNWKRAYVSLRHLVEFLTSGHASEKKCSSGKKCHIAPQIPLSNYFEKLTLKDSMDEEFQWSADARLPTSSSQFFVHDTMSSDSNHLFTSSTTSELCGFVEPLEKMYELAALTNIEKLQILAIIDLLTEIQHSSSAYDNLDEPGRRFWVALRFQQLQFCRGFGRSSSVEELVVDTRLMSWAFHSECQETLISSFLPNEPTWKEMQTLGVGFWFTNVAQLRTRVEKLARKQYLRNRDPKDCALLYIALNRLQVLAGLFKISKDEKDKLLVGFLSRNFQEEKNKAAALKNAYVLMGRHQLELAIAFFLLGGDNYSAITVCAKNLGDEQLALIICRLVEGHGGPLQHHLITKFILPAATERGDYWLASLLEWELGNCLQSFLCMVGFQTSSVIDKYAISSNHTAFMDPHIGLHCLKLATKSCMRNAIGEQNAATLSRWATFMAATAFNRSGLPLEALECLSSSSSISGGTDQGSILDVDHTLILRGILKPSASDSLNWLSDSVALHLESCAKLDLALQYFSKLMVEHPSWPDSILGSVQLSTCFRDCEVHQYEELQKNFRDKLYTGLTKFEQKFSVASSHLIKMILVWLCNNGLLFIGYDILLGYASLDHSDESHSVGKLVLYRVLHKPLLKSIEDISLLLSRFIVSCNITCLQPKSFYIDNDVSGEVRSTWSDTQAHYFQGIMRMLWSLRSAMRIICGFLSEDVTARTLVILDLYEFYVHFASAWLQRNLKGLLLMVQPLLITCTNGHIPYEVDMENLKNILYHIAELLASDLSVDDAGSGHGTTKNHPCNLNRETMRSFSEDEKWHIIGACLWQHMSRLMKHKLHLLSINVEDSCFSGASHSKVTSWASSSMNFRSDNSIAEQIVSLSLILSKVLKTTLIHLSSYHIKVFGSFLLLKVENRLPMPTLAWIRESNPSQAEVLYQDASADIMNSKDELSTFDILWDTCADPNLIIEGFAQENINWLQFVNHGSSEDWSGLYKSIREDYETKEVLDQEVRLGNNPSSDEVESSAKGLFKNGRAFLTSWQKDSTIAREVPHFQTAKEIYKRDGELLEALCINSVCERQAAISSNRKGIIFFSWEDGIPFGDQSEYIWSDADWPPNGWAGAESTPVPTCVSPGVGLGSKKGAHLGLGGATLGMGSLARPRRDLTGGGAFGIPGYAGIGASGLGWEVQEDFEEFVDPPATLENISTRAFCSHPSRPFFLVGSSNTHIYLWEFGKDKATATYGVLPAANVPPPYALASISALQFDHCGHRFATAALDGTVCTWQLEVGGRSNIRPTESSLCFNGHASDVAYVTSSGSVVAAAGYSSNGVNVVVWDTLAPPTTSRASIVRHEGGARSISVFDHDIGSGSISPLIVTGGRGGDVGLHDFRYIATGRTKRHRHFDNGDGRSNMPSNMDLQAGVGKKVGDQNQNGMLWYIPKAHLGSVTKISTIPHTSLFLTGSKDGDVKLWDAKAAKLVYHWPKLHERRTFLQPSSRGFGGVVRAAVTDIQVVSHGFLTCGGDGLVKLVQLKDNLFEK